MPPTVLASCAVGTGECQDTGAWPDPAWLAPIGMIVAIVVIAVIVYYAVRGSRGR